MMEWSSATHSTLSNYDEQSCEDMIEKGGFVLYPFGIFTKEVIFVIPSQVLLFSTKKKQTNQTKQRHQLYTGLFGVDKTLIG